jgi:predicted deacylase
MARLAAVRPSSAFATVDYDRLGKQVGFVMIPHSPHDDAWGVTRVPVAVIANGTGPTVIIEGGNHGDEYEGPITICELIRELDPGEVQGRLILMPANNVHAVMAGRRTSPVDGLNFNRTFPGNPQGTITDQISAYVNDHVLTIGDAFLDLHSGGSSLDILPSAIVEPTDDPDLRKRNIAAVRAFGAPLEVVISNLGEPRTATAAACRAGLVTVGTEMAGGGRVSLDALAICRRGVRNVLAHLGVLDTRHAQPAESDGLMLELPGTEAYVFATGEGIFEPFHPNGTEVRAGQPAGRIHCTWDPGREPEVLHYLADGLVYGRRQPGHVKPGNCCMVVAARYAGEIG